MVTVSRLTGVTTAVFAATLLLSAQPVTHAQSPARPAASPTFSKDVLPILQK